MNNSLALVKDLDYQEMALTLSLIETSDICERENGKYIPKSLLKAHVPMYRHEALDQNFSCDSLLMDFAYCLFIKNGCPDIKNFSEHYPKACEIEFIQSADFTKINVITSPQKPLALIYLNSDCKDDEKIYSSIDITVQENVVFTLVEHFAAWQKSFFAHVSLTTKLMANAKINHFFLNESLSENKYVYENSCTFLKNSNNKSFHLNFGSGQINAQLEHKLDEGFAQTNFFAADLLGENAQAHTVLNIFHNNQDTVSHQVFRAVYADCSVGNFLGKVTVQANGQRSKASQHYKSIVVGNKSKAFSRPQMEIYNSDISASHGATIGELDEDVLFYLQSRGLSLKESKKMLVKALLKEVLEKIDNEKIKNFADDILHNTLSKSNLEENNA